MNFEPPDQWYTVVGVVPPVKQDDLSEDGSKETIYFHYTQPSLPFGWLVLRTTLPTDQLTGPAKAAVAALDPELALYGTAAYDTFLDRALGPERTPMVLTLVFAAVAFTLAVIGVYGVLTWAVTQRFGELGVRIALGARGRDIVGMVLAQGGKLIAIGSALGLVGAACDRPRARVADPHRERTRSRRARWPPCSRWALPRSLRAGCPRDAPGRTDPMVALRAE